jgi:anti-sigma B factor antagonist
MSCETEPSRPVIEVGDAPLGGASGLSVAGEIDLSTCPVVEAALDAAIVSSVGAFVLDLSAVGFMDSSGVNVLLRARALLGRAERDMVLICPGGPVLHVLEAVGVAELFAVFPSRAEAARHLVPAS